MCGTEASSAGEPRRTCKKNEALSCSCSFDIESTAGSRAIADAAWGSFNPRLSSQPRVSSQCLVDIDQKSGWRHTKAPRALHSASSAVPAELKVSSEVASRTPASSSQRAFSRIKVSGECTSRGERTITVPITSLGTPRSTRHATRASSDESDMRSTSGAREMTLVRRPPGSMPSRSCSQLSRRPMDSLEQRRSAGSARNTFCSISSGSPVAAASASAAAKSSGAGVSSSAGSCATA
mmetsp:Transcript_30107/g.60400  ORF Transcript_30107/g.60400 Transcript_30107/m.60400 type:complete len:237 (-) Transcript_30107:307-1017(-)